MRFLLSLFLLLATWTPALAEKRIAFSFDDVPRHAGASFTPEARTTALIEALRKGGVRQAGFFVTTGNLDKPFGVGGEARIAAYAAAGHVIANHSADHPLLSRTPVADYVAGVDRAEAWLAGRPGHRPWFRYPYLDEAGRQPEKRDAVRKGLGERGLPMDVAYADPIARVEPDTGFLGEGRVAALAHLAGRRPRDLVHERTDEAVLTGLFRTRVLGRTTPR